MIWTGVALVGAVDWGVVAVVRGEEISAIWLVTAALGSYYRPSCTLGETTGQEPFAAGSRIATHST
ncbi:hypothetical protein ABZ070_01420 [Streptomyces sp. NPDC006283]|uniref:hypothetical protein n=1 Tax=Streptomyces sp. NPDC006283 TaxID=3156741 RepID=UPI0033AF988A